MEAGDKLAAATATLQCSGLLPPFPVHALNSRRMNAPMAAAATAVLRKPRRISPEARHRKKQRWAFSITSQRGCCCCPVALHTVDHAAVQVLAVNLDKMELSLRIMMISATVESDLRRAAGTINTRSALPPALLDHRAPKARRRRHHDIHEIDICICCASDTATPVCRQWTPSNACPTRPCHAPFRQSPNHPAAELLHWWTTQPSPVPAAATSQSLARRKAFRCKHCGFEGGRLRH